MRTRGSWLTPLAFALAASTLLLSTGEALAGPEEREARSAWMKGKRALMARRLAEAETALCHAMELSPIPQHVIDCARSLVGQEKWREAREVLEPWSDSELDMTPLEVRAMAALWKDVEAHDTVEKPRKKNVDDTSIDDAPPDTKPQPNDSKGTPWPGVVTLAAGGVALGVGATFGIMASTTASDVHARCRGDICPAEVADDARASAAYGDVSTASFIVGGALAVGGVALLFAFSGDDDDDDARSARGGGAALFVSPRSAGVRGSF